MGSKAPEEKAANEKISDLLQIVDTAYLLFEGKYTMKELQSEMPYKKLIAEIEREQNMSKDLEEIKASRRANKLF